MERPSNMCEIHSYGELIDLVKTHKLCFAGFTTPSCATCRRISQNMPQIARECPEVQIIRINVEEHKELADEFQLSSVPVVKLFKGMEGDKPKEVYCTLDPNFAEIRAKIHENLE